MYKLVTSYILVRNKFINWVHAIVYNPLQVKKMSQLLLTTTITEIEEFPKVPKPTLSPF